MVLYCLRVEGGICVMCGGLEGGLYGFRMVLYSSRGGGGVWVMCVRLVGIFLVLYSLYFAGL